MLFLFSLAWIWAIQASGLLEGLFVGQTGGALIATATLITMFLLYLLRGVTEKLFFGLSQMGDSFFFLLLNFFFLLLFLDIPFE